METAIVWFRNNLRLQQNAVLQKAIENFKNIIYVYVLDDYYFGETEFGFPKMGAYRAKFLIECLADLRKNIEAKGGSLLIYKGNTVEKLTQLSYAFNAKAIFAQKEQVGFEIEIEKNVASEINCKLKLVWDNTLYHPENIPLKLEEIPFVFTDFRKICETEGKIQLEFDNIVDLFGDPNIISSALPSLADLNCTKKKLDKRASFNFIGGETEAWKRMHAYFWETKEIGNYFEKRNNLFGADFSSKLSPYLSFGCISPVSIYNEILRYENQIQKNKSTYWLVFKLIWRDFFKYIAQKYGNSIFYKNGIRNKPCDTIWDEKLFKHWQLGKTGVPFVDANMKELLLTGNMSNRGRQNVASFLVHDLKLDWRAGAEWFESQLIDFDVCSNYCNWNYIAGIGNDPRENRYFNVILQAKKYDSEAQYIKTWLPELSNLSPEMAIEPWKLDNNKLDYPQPIVKGGFYSE